MQCLHRASPRLALRRTSCTKSALQPCSRRRQFHAPSISDALIWTTESFSSIHAAGVPWYITIPLIAVGVNVTFRLPLQYYSRKVAVKRVALRPLMQAWQSRHIRTSGSPQSAGGEDAWKAKVSALSAKSNARLNKEWGAQTYKLFTPLLGLLPFTLVSESLRRLCGAKSGWVKLPDAVPEGVAQSIPTGEGLIKTIDLLDKSMVDGGCLWFTDLTATDPYMALPLVCSALLAKTAWGNLDATRLRALFSLEGSQEVKGFSNRMQQAAMRLAVMMPIMPILVSHLPAAVFLYWASSFSLNIVNAAVLDKLLPRQAPAQRELPKAPHMKPFLAAQK